MPRKIFSPETDHRQAAADRGVDRPRTTRIRCNIGSRRHTSRLDSGIRPINPTHDQRLYAHSECMAAVHATRIHKRKIYICQ